MAEQIADDDAAKPGEQNGRAVLTEASIRGIKASLGASQRELAKIHGVGQTTIRDILKSKTWRHVK